MLDVHFPLYICHYIYMHIDSLQWCRNLNNYVYIRFLFSYQFVYFTWSVFKSYYMYVHAISFLNCSCIRYLEDIDLVVVHYWIYWTSWENFMLWSSATFVFTKSNVKYLTLCFDFVELLVYIFFTFYVEYVLMAICAIFASCSYLYHWLCYMHYGFYMPLILFYVVFQKPLRA